MRDQVPQPGTEPGPLHWEQGLSHWITRGVPVLRVNKNGLLNDNST